MQDLTLVERLGAGMQDLTLVERLSAQLLAGPPAPDAAGVAERLLAIQAQDPRGARLAVRARTRGLTVADVDRPLTVDRSLVITTLNRGTLHLVRSEDLPWLHAVTTPQLATTSARRLAQEGVAPDAADRGVAAIERSLSEEGPLTRAQLRDRVAAAGVRTEGQAFVHLVMRSALRGSTVRGPMVDGQHAFVLTRDWLGPQPAPPDRAAALAELARRYLAGHGPATDRDLARWAGLPLGQARAGLRAIAAELAERPDGLLDLRGRPEPAEPPPPRLLGPFEPLLLGWADRTPLLRDDARLVTVNGIFKAFALVDGRAAATWRLAAGGLELDPFAPLAPGVDATLAADAADISRFLLGT
jgi:hypothetical protein